MQNKIINENGNMILEIGVQLMNDQADLAYRYIRERNANLDSRSGEDKVYSLNGKTYELTFEYEDTIPDYCVYFKRVA